MTVLRKQRLLQLAAATAIAGLLIACGGTPSAVSDPRAATPVDFGGFWEMNYGKSDNIQEQLTVLMRNLRRQAEQAAQNRSERGAGVTIGSAASNSAPSIVGLARMADLITASQLLEVQQTRTNIRIKREGDFALTCDFLRQATDVIDLGVGKEACGWDGSQLVFRISLPEGLAIRHRASLSPSGQQMGIVTTVFSDRVTNPFTVTRIYDRYVPGDAGYRCEMTLTRGRVCTTEDQP